MSDAFLAELTSLTVLAVGAHPDDIELGAGGFIYRLRRKLGARVHFLILTHGENRRGNSDGFDRNQRHRESIEAAGVLGIETNDVTILDHADRKLQSDLHLLIGEIETMTSDKRFDIVLTHTGGDTHQDHRAAHDATIAGTRSFGGTVLLYQAASTIPNEFRPTFFVDLKPDELDVKQRAIQKHVSQRGKSFTAEDRTRSMAPSWASFFNVPGKLFEAFEVYKSFWN